MYEVTVERRFSAAHFLRGYRGADEALHGHNWRVQVAVQAPDTGPDGTAYDFVTLRDELDRVLAGLDHRNLNDVGPFADGLSPSAEHVARYIHGQLDGRGTPPIRLSWVRVWETEDCSVRYTPG